MQYQQYDKRDKVLVFTLIHSMYLLIYFLAMSTGHRNAAVQCMMINSLYTVVFWTNYFLRDVLMARELSVVVKSR